MTEQLELLREHPRTGRKKRVKPETCKCTHPKEAHNNGKGGCRVCAENYDRAAAGMGALAGVVLKVCRRFTPKKRAPIADPEHLQPPAGALILQRPNKDESKAAGTVFEKTMGWAVDRGNVIEIYLSQFKTLGTNSLWRGASMRARIGMRIQQQQGHDRARAAIDQVFALRDGEPSDRLPLRLEIARVSPRTDMNDDNRNSALKFIRDGVAEAFGVDDAAFDAAFVDRIELVYANEASGKNRVNGVRIRIFFEVRR